MDKLRIVLIAAFALISFMLVIEFAKFKDEKSKASLLAKQSSSLINESQSSNSISEPQSVDEVPVINELVKEAGIPESNNFNTDLIKVTTDTLDVLIDPQGGDIVYVALHKYLARLDTPEIPFVILEKTNNRTYIAQSGLIGKNGTDTSTGRPLFRSSQSTYLIKQDEQTLTVDLSLEENGVLITKRFIFNRGAYLIDVNYIIQNRSAQTWEAAFYGQIKRDGSKDPASDSGNMGIAPYLGFATTTAEDRFKKIDFEDAQEKSFTNKYQGGWIAMIQHYFLSAWIADQTQEHEYSTVYSKTGFYLARVKSPITVVAAGSEGEIRSSFYVGPKNQYLLAKISESLDLSVDYGMLWMIAQPLYALLYFFDKGELHAFGQEYNLFSGIGNWGFSIILLTIFVKLCFFSLNAKAYTSMAKMRAIQPKMLEIKDRYADDKQRQSKEMMALYGKEGVNPLGGCLPMLVQMPVFISLYWVLLESVELRHAPFIGYIHDLSAMDPYFIMPLIMGASMWFQQKLNPPPPDPMQAKIMQFLPIIFTFFFLFFPSGLVLYWIVNNVLSIAQQWLITKRIEAASAST
jgi:YidC/Oxa1 family membrane protein insertase